MGSLSSSKVAALPGWRGRLVKSFANPAFAHAEIADDNPSARPPCARLRIASATDVEGGASLTQPRSATARRRTRSLESQLGFLFRLDLRWWRWSLRCTCRQFRSAALAAGSILGGSGKGAGWLGLARAGFESLAPCGRAARARNLNARPRLQRLDVEVFADLASVGRLAGSVPWVAQSAGLRDAPPVSTRKTWRGIDSRMMMPRVCTATENRAGAASNAPGHLPCPS